MDFNTSSFSPNQLPNFMSMLPHQVPQYHHSEDKEKQALQLFWEQQAIHIQITEAFKSQQQLHLARIKKIIKADKDVKMISAETPMLLAKASEIFIQELTLRAWMTTEENKRRTVQRCDIAKAIRQHDVLDFLADVPCDHDHHYAPNNKEEDNGKDAEGNQANLPYAAGFMGNPMMNVGSDLVAGNQQFPQPYMMQPPFMPSDFPYNFHPK